MKTTLNAIKENVPCVAGYRTLLKFLGKRRADNDPLDLSTILESNGFDDAVWCFRTVSGFDAEKRLFAVFCAKQVQHHMTDHRSLAAINVAEQYANGQATVDELTAARVDAFNAAKDAAVYSIAANAAYAAYSAAVAHAAAYSAFYAVDVDSEIKPVLEAYLKELLSVK